MSERLVTERELEGVLRRLQDFERRLGRVEVTEVPIVQTGTWTPTLVGATTPGTFTYDVTNTKGEYTRIGNRVLFQGWVRFTAIGTAPVGSMYISGLPAAVTPGTTGFNVPGGAWFMVYTLDLPAGYSQVTGQFVDASTNLVLLRNGDNVAPANVAGGEVVLIGGAGDFRFAGMYRI